MKFGAGGRHEGSFKGLFCAKRSRDGREEDRAPHNTHLGCAPEDCTCAMVASPAHWPCFLGIVDLCCRLIDRTFASD